MDARRQQTYTGIYELKNGALEILQQQCAVGINEIIAQINEIGRPVTFLGDGVAVFHDISRKIVRWHTIMRRHI